MTTKYEIRTDTFEFHFGASRCQVPAMNADAILETYLSCDTNITSNSLDPEARESFDSEREAREFFAANYADYGSTRIEDGNTQYLLRGRLAWLEENEYDEDGEFADGGAVLEVSAEGYEPDEEEEEDEDDR